MRLIIFHSPAEFLNYSAIWYLSSADETLTYHVTSEIHQIPILRPDTDSWRWSNLCSPQPCHTPSYPPRQGNMAEIHRLGCQHGKKVDKWDEKTFECKFRKRIACNLSVAIVLNDPVPGLVFVFAKSHLPFFVVKQIWFILKNPLRHLFQCSSTFFWIFLVFVNDPLAVVWILHNEFRWNSRSDKIKLQLWAGDSSHSRSCFFSLGVTFQHSRRLVFGGPCFFSHGYCRRIL